MCSSELQQVLLPLGEGERERVTLSKDWMRVMRGK